MGPKPEPKPGRKTENGRTVITLRGKFSTARRNRRAMGKLTKLRNGMVAEVLAKFFYWWGCKVASNPKKVIVASFLAASICSLGLLNFNSEADGWGYWLPEGSRHKTVQDWKDKYFAEDTRGTITLFKHEENVLTREGLILLLDLHERVRAVKNYTSRSNWILHRKRKYFPYCLIDVILKKERDLSNGI